MASEHNPEHDKQPYDDVNTRSLFLVGLLALILVFVAIVAVQTVYFRYEESEFQRKIINSGPSEAEQVIVAQKERIRTGGEGANPEANEKAIPISEAMSAVVAEYQAKQSQSEPGATEQ